MKRLKFAFAAAFVAASAPAVAQLPPTGLDFVQAVRSSDGDKATQLLQDHPAGFIDSRDGDGNTGLIIAVTRRDEQWTAFLLGKGADPNVQGKAGDTALIIASRIGFDEAVDWLLQVGAKVDLANRMGETPLISAVEQRQASTVKLLLAAGADPDKTDTAAGYSARDYAQRDPRARDILQLINAKKPKPAAGR